MTGEPLKPVVVAIVLNYNGAEDTIACVQSLRCCTYSPLEILVVDNGSSGECVANLQAKLPDTRILLTGRNLGFAAGNNRGARQAVQHDPKYILFLNNDTLVEPDFIEPLVQAMERNARVAAAGGTICYYPRTDLVWFGGGAFRPLRASSFSMYENTPADQIPERPTRQVTFLTGCMMLVRSGLFQQVGGFDERFFMYFEDADLCVRLLSRGHTLMFVRASRIYHKVQNRPLSPFIMYYWMRNRFLFVRNAVTGWKKPLTLAYLCTVTAMKLLVWSVAKPHLFRAATMGLCDFFTNRFYEGRGTSFLPSPSTKNFSAS